MERAGRLASADRGDAARVGGRRRVDRGDGGARLDHHDTAGVVDLEGHLRGRAVDRRARRVDAGRVHGHAQREVGPGQPLRVPVDVDGRPDRRAVGVEDLHAEPLGRVGGGEEAVLVGDAEREAGLVTRHEHRAAEELGERQPAGRRGGGGCRARRLDRVVAAARAEQDGAGRCGPADEQLAAGEEGCGPGSHPSEPILRPMTEGSRPLLQLEVDGQQVEVADEGQTAPGRPPRGPPAPLTEGRLQPAGPVRVLHGARGRPASCGLRDPGPAGRGPCDHHRRRAAGRDGLGRRLHRHGGQPVRVLHPRDHLPPQCSPREEPRR